jgi:uncharacterized protein (TIGR00369 family)
METTAELTPLVHKGYNLCFGCGQDNPAGLKLEFYLAQDKSSVCLATIPGHFEGPPGCVHGGVIATILDETMHKAIRAQGVAAAVTRTLEIEYRRPVPTLQPIRVEAHLIENEGRNYRAEARILNSAGKELATGKATFVEVRADRMMRSEKKSQEI